MKEKTVAKIKERMVELRDKIDFFQKSGLGNQPVYDFHLMTMKTDYTVLSNVLWMENPEVKTPLL